jgi:hypothetical protein
MAAVFPPIRPQVIDHAEALALIETNRRLPVLFAFCRVTILNKQEHGLGSYISKQFAGL